MSIALPACGGGGPGGPVGGEIAFVREATVRGVTYRVNQQPGTTNRFQVATADGGRGTAYGAHQAVRKTYQCQYIQLHQTGAGWSEAEGKGTFCHIARNYEQRR